MKAKTIKLVLRKKVDEWLESIEDELNLTKISVLEDQLTGVDAAYFLQVITLLKAKNPDSVNQAYLVEIVDRMF